MIKRVYLFVYNVLWSLIECNIIIDYLVFHSHPERTQIKKIILHNSREKKNNRVFIHKDKMMYLIKHKFISKKMEWMNENWNE